MHVVCVCFAWLVDADGDLGLIDPKEPVLEKETETETKKETETETKRKQEGRIWSRFEGWMQREPKLET